MRENFTKSMLTIVIIMMLSTVVFAQSTPTTTILCTYLTYPYDVTPTGDKIALQGFDYYTSYYWEENQEIVPIVGVVNGVSTDGKLCGWYQDPNFVIYDMTIEVAGLWNSQTQEWEFLGMNPNAPEFLDFQYNSAWAMTSDGSIVVGLQWMADYSYKAYKWSPETGYTTIGGNSTRASAVSSDGHLIGGFTQGTTSRTPVIWVDDQQITFNPDIEGETFCVSNNGIYAAGTWGDQSCFVWTEETGVVTFDNTLNSNFMGITCASDNGNIFGYTSDSQVSLAEMRRAFVRHDDGTMQTANDYFKERGLDDADQWTFYMITDLTPNDNIFVGCGVNPQGNPVSFKIDFSDNTGLNDNVLSEVKVYPNPAEGYCMIPIDDFTSKVEIISAGGNIVFSTEIIDNESSMKIDTEDFAQGVYYVRIESVKGTKTGKIVVL